MMMMMMMMMMMNIYLHKFYVSTAQSHFRN